MNPSGLYVAWSGWACLHVCKVPGLPRFKIGCRSSKLAASSRSMNVDKGSQQNISVTSGKWLALRVGPMGLYTNITTARRDLIKSFGPSRWSFDGVEDAYFGALSLAQWITSSKLERTRVTQMPNWNKILRQTEMVLTKYDFYPVLWMSKWRNSTKDW